ncbi:MAG TPA: endonuclease III [Candidatus Pullichristensenella excrementigallinarum]|uniref:Endonuclease III n=1 Tax=Candidatus Pullichristensenella excrementigallinarum TaxID=2840907 RepID=A0A9D1LBV6_9FIRM|nr:endonuclease III [Candidatus Pullichristensenella excrementigallinarum]
MEAWKAERVLDALETLYPQARAELHFSNPFETLVATILSAQCTDKRVNQVTAKLFPQYPDAFAMAKLEPEELEPLIRECGLFRNKAKNIVAASRALVEKYDGNVPSTRQELMALPGVGQKTAGVVLLAAFGGNQIPVDTHVFRVSRRIGLAQATTPAGVEKELRALLPEARWSHAHHLLIWHGRRICHARGPECDRCPLRDELCEYREQE